MYPLPALTLVALHPKWPRFHLLPSSPAQPDSHPASLAADTCRSAEAVGYPGGGGCAGATATRRRRRAQLCAEPEPPTHVEEGQHGAEVQEDGK